MQKIHQKHNKIYSGLFIILSFFISILLFNPKEAKADSTLPSWVPPTSPLANKEHPRLFFTSGDLPALRNKLKTQYKIEFQDFINLMDAGFDKGIALKTNSERSYDAMNYAFLYLIDPSTIMPTFTFGHTRDEYGRKSIEHSLSIADNVLAGIIITDRPHSAPPDSRPINMPMALSYDWCQPLLTLSEKRKTADALIKMYSVRDRQPGVQLSGGTMADNFSGPTGGLAIWGDNLDDSLTNGYYAVQSQILLDLIKTDWIDGIYASLNYFQDKSGWRESWSYDSMGAFPNINFFSGLLSSAVGQNYFYETGYLRYHPLFFLYSIRPYSYNGENYLIRYDTMTEKGKTQSTLYSNPLYGAINPLTSSDSNMAGLAQWVIDRGYVSSISNTSYNIRYCYLFYLFTWGNKNVISKSPQDLNLPIAQKFGSGQIIMRTGFTNPSDTLIQFWAPKFDIAPGGHSHIDFSSFTIEKYGQLALDAGNTKSLSVDGRAVPRFSGPRNSMFHNTIGVYKPGETDGSNNFMGYIGGRNTTADRPSDPVFQDGGANHIGNLKAWEPNTGDYTYANYDYSRAWDPKKVSYANREFVYLNPTVTSNKEFVVVFDRVTSVDPSYKKRWLLWSSFQPETNGTYTQDANIPWKWESNDSNIVKITNNYGTNHGRLFSKTLLPGSFKINKTGGPGHEFTDAEYVNLTTADQDYGQLTDAEADWIGAWRTEVESTTNQKDDLFLHVLEVGDSKTLTTMTPTTRIDADNMTGTLIDDPVTPRIILFTKNQTGANVSTATYIANYSSTKTGKHLLAGITPGTYDIYKNGTKIHTGIKSENGKNTLSFSSTGGSTFSIVQTGIAPPVYQCSDGIDNDGDAKIDYPNDPGCSSETDNDEKDTVISDTIPPSTPTNLKATPISLSQINLTWTQSTDNTAVTSYKIYRCQGASCTPTVQIATSTTPTYSNTNLTANTSYTYAISALDAANNESAKSTSSFATTLKTFLLSDTNQDGKVDSTDFGTLKLDWNKTIKPKSDINQDGIVDTRDLGIMMGEWGG